MSDAQLMSEPEAAAASYANEERVAAGEVIAVYDLGGGTFNTTVMRRTATGFEIMGRPDGIERLGGVDFDAAVFGFVAEALGPDFDELDPTDDEVALSMLETRAYCTRAKEALSADTETVINIPLPTGLRQVRLTRVEFEAMIRPPITETITVLERTVAEAGVTPAQIDRVLLVGGSSWIPLVAELIVGTLGRPVAVNVHPKHTVALGAALGLQLPGDEAAASSKRRRRGRRRGGSGGRRRHGSHGRRRTAVALAVVAIVLLAAGAALAIRAWP